MFSSTRMITFASAALALASLNGVLAAPAPLDGDISAISSREVAPASRFVIYSDNWVTGGLPAASALDVSAVSTLSYLTSLTHALP